MPRVELWALFRNYIGLTLMEFGARVMTDECKVEVKRRLCQGE